MKIEVTQADIDAGQRCGSQKCPVALAVLRATGTAWRIVPNEMVMPDDNSISVELPDEVQDWILNFDCCDTVAPFTFDLPLSAQPNP